MADPTNEKPEPNGELAALEGLTFTTTDPAPGADGAQAGPGGAPPEEAKAVQAMEAALGAVVFGLLRAARAMIGRRMPEIHEHWPDDVLRLPADASVPVLRRYAGQVSQWAAQYPELAGLGFACLPLAMGYAAAVEQHAATVTDVQPKAKPAEAAPVNPAPAPQATATAPGVFRVG